MTKASEYHKQGYTCGEAIIKSYNEEHNTNIPVGLGSSMGTGYTVGSLCGAVGAAAVIVGSLKGRESNDETNEARKYTKELMMNIKEKYGTELCRDLKKNGVSCAEIIDYTYETLNKIL
ncbi:C-GCAxxG-C-C family (seleno)protein [Clostridium magnum]|uniref:Putative redox-active protein n=1 Tax=Clostridium magnum DSM 2767 TaxID=1121326 RepID=A0A161Y3Q5_9CLOT|nr:C-GCAxxG-C-C family (seleno)protein [Clostridium magnum]KZL92699.1 putative redox-active protein [Clostridium magnum DSM 2767]SHI24591.1 C_GCAxxG_C_C family probable redox protein [Clostridium magnum DSM 2767]